MGFKGQHINPLSNFKNLVALRNLFEIYKSLFKMILISLFLLIYFTNMHLHLDIYLIVALIVLFRYWVL
nr:EscU/YscU/HrcU family type III secretion system export apparatus switch protein [Candidatus Hamiltonella defensa]